MKDSFKIGVNVDQAAKHLGISDNRFYKALPKSIRNFRFQHQMKSPTKLGVRDRYRAPNRGGKSVARSIRSETPGGIGGFGGTGNWLDFYRPENQKRLRDQYTTGQPVRGADQQGPGIGGIRPIRGIPPRGLPGRPQRDTIAMMYENILGRKADQGGLDYWRSELESGKQTRDDIRQNILRSDEFQGRSDTDRQAALRGVEQRRSLRRQTRRGRPPRLGPAVLPSIRGKGKAKFTGKKITGRGLFPSIAAATAARGGF